MFNELSHDLYEFDERLLLGVASATCTNIPSTKPIARHSPVIRNGFFIDLLCGTLGILPSLNLHLELRLHHYRSPA
jgi:hypothetical protein